ncbi:RICIN domain-containing protein [Lentzea sp. NPDC051208]|uniref:RICIN domain-containing protein n=1 Tax=Lentzea sp. NPDC051208 TaxID=3154642 RepID=UPI003447B3ED
MVATLNTTAQAAEKITYVKRTGEVTAQYLSTWTNINTGRCLAIRAASNYNGSPAFQHDCGFADQVWNLWYIGYDRWEIRNAYTGRCLAIKAADNYNGSPAFQYDCLGFDDQRWFVVDAYDSVGHYLHSFAINNYTGRCLAVRSADNYNGAPAFQHDCVTSYSDQQWKIRNA